MSKRPRRNLTFTEKVQATYTMFGWVAVGICGGIGWMFVVDGEIPVYAEWIWDSWINPVWQWLLT